jgi:predicted ATP-binding protein involved in virulence
VRIDHLTIQNFRGFELSEFEFNPHFNLVVGDNATGKTSVLDALSIAVGSWFLGMPGYVKVPGISSDEVRVIAHPYQDVYSFDKQFPSRIQARGIVMGQALIWTRELSRVGGRTTSTSAQNVSSAATEAEVRARDGENITLPLICAYGTERLWFETTHRKSAKSKSHNNVLPSRLDGYRDCIDFTIKESALLDWIRAEVSASQQRGSETLALRVIKQAIVDCVEGAESLYYDERYKDLVVSIKSYGQQLFQNLSDGQRIMLTLVGDLAKRATTLNPHLGGKALEETPGIVTIDELDLHLHLHPKWQRHVIHDLKATFPSLQFIATTHSPQLIGEALPEEVVRLGQREPSHPAQSFGMDSNWILRHVMGAEDRDREVKVKLDEIESLINSFHLDTAQSKIDELRSAIGNHPDLVRFSARIDRFSRKAQ